MKDHRAPALALLTLFASPCFAQGPFIVPIGDLPGGLYRSWASDISSDGKTIVGNSNDRDGFGEQGIRWTLDGGLEGLGDLPGGFDDSPAQGVSADGQYVVGNSSATNGYQSYVWSKAAGMVGVPNLAGSKNTKLRDVSDGGRVAAGDAIMPDSKHMAVRWTPEGGMKSLGTLPGGEGLNAWAERVSADGRVITGSSAGKVNSKLGLYAFRWFEDAGMTALQDLAGSDIYNLPHGMSDDGRWVVGEASSAEGIQAALWGPDGSVLGLGMFDAGTYSRAYGVSRDGRVVVGESLNKPFIWTPERGMRQLRDVLADYGFDLDATGRHFYEIVGVSADGHWFVANGDMATGTEPCLIYIPLPAPGPAAVLVLSLSGFSSTSRRRGAAPPAAL